MVAFAIDEPNHVTIDNVPSYRTAKGVAVDVPGLRRYVGDVAWGGNWFFLVQEHGETLDLAHAERLTDVSIGQWCADNQLIGLKLAHPTLSVGDTDFSCEQLGRTYRGKLIVRPTPNPNFRRVDAQIFTTTDGRALDTIAVSR